MSDASIRMQSPARARWRRPDGSVLRYGATGALVAAMSGAAALVLGWWSLPPLAVLSGTLLMLAARVPAAPVAAATASAGSESAGNSQRLAVQLVPVWKRNIEAARSHSEHSMSTLLDSFGRISQQLDQALGHSQGATPGVLGATDELMARHHAEVDALLATTRDMAALQVAMHEALREVGDELSSMGELAREVQSIGRATHLLALNASVEATRGGAAGTGFAAVAVEVRELAAQSRQAGTQLTRHLAALQERLERLRRQADQNDLDADELALRAEQAARTVVRALLTSIADISRSSRDLQTAGRAVATDIERVFVGLQSQDRLSQMLQSVTDDMHRYSDWLHGAEDPAATHPADWLARLEASYTMEEMRSSHHGNTVVDQNAGVEFF